MDTVQLLKELVAIPSFTREEARKADYLQSLLQGWGCEPKREGDNVWCIAPDYDPSKPTLLLNSHIDTVKPCPSWTRQPHRPVEENGRIYGLGSNDAHASLVSLIEVFLQLRTKPRAYNLLLALSVEEEISGHEGMERLLRVMPPIHLGVVGEPTGMRLAVAEKGLMVMDCVATGKSGHAAREEGINAIYQALPDIEWFRTYRFPKRSATLGEVKMAVTVVHAGELHNVVPDTCRFTVDMRLTDCYTHAEALEIIRSHVHCSVTPRSQRLGSSGIPLQHPLVQRYLKTGGEVFGSATMSDQAFMRFPSVKIGPGDSARSHTADEYIGIDELKAAPALYLQLLDGLEFSME